jgi:glycosyltransferase involved in cell wall biosynthesis
MIRRIGHVTTDFRPPVGGAEAYVADLIRELAPLAEEQIVFQLDNSDRDPSLRDDPSVVLIPRWRGRWKHSRGHNLYGFNWRLRRRAFRAQLAKCDLLIVNYPFHWPPVAWHPRTVVISHCVEWSQPPRSWTHRRRRKIARRCDREALTLVANDTNFWREMGRDVPPKTHLWEAVAPRRWCLPNAVDTDLFTPEGERRVPERLRLWLSRAQGQPRPFILVARNASPHRGIHLAIEALGHFAALQPDLALVVVGSRAKPDYQRVLDQTAATFGITDRVCHFGHLPRQEMPALCRAATLSLVPTVEHEGTSLSALEAMASGVPTISTNHGGLADLPTVQVKPDAQLLAKALERVWVERETIAAKQREVVTQKFNMARWGEAWRHVVEEAMAAPVRKP